MKIYLTDGYRKDRRNRNPQSTTISRGYFLKYHLRRKGRAVWVEPARSLFRFSASRLRCLICALRHVEGMRDNGQRGRQRAFGGRQWLSGFSRSIDATGYAYDRTTVYTSFFRHRAHPHNANTRSTTNTSSSETEKTSSTRSGHQQLVSIYIVCRWDRL
jgi:hypothetical protein